MITLSAIYLLSRFVNLTKLPIFNDEAIYLDWGWKSLHTNAGLFYSLYDAKPPLLIWIFGILESIASDPLFVGRFVSVLTGLLTLIGIYKIAKNLGGVKLAILSSIFYIVIPLFAFFDRQALMESGITAVGVWSFYFLDRIIETKKIRYSLFLGLVLGTGIFTKLSGLVFVVIVIAILTYKKLFKEIGVVIITGLIVLSPLLFQGSFWSSFGSNNRFMLSPSELLKFPFPLWFKNITNTINVLFFLLTPFIFIFSIYGIFLLFKNKKWLLPTFFLLNIILILVGSQTLNPRYLTSFLVIATIFSSYAIFSFKKTFIIPAIVVGIALPIILTSILVFAPLSYFNFLGSLTPLSQKGEYVTNWTSGYGVPETVNYLDSQSKNKKVIVAVRIDAGNPESAMFAYFEGTDNVKVIYLDPRMLGSDLSKMNCIPSDVPVYFVARDNSLNGLDKFFTEVKRFYKPERSRFISIYLLKPCS